MEKKKASFGRLYKSKGMIVLVASKRDSCPTMKVPKTGQDARLRDDYSRGFKVPKGILGVVFS